MTPSIPHVILHKFRKLPAEGRHQFLKHVLKTVKICSSLTFIINLITAGKPCCFTSVQHTRVLKMLRLADWWTGTSIFEGACRLILYQLNTRLSGPQNRSGPYRELNHDISTRPARTVISTPTTLPECKSSTSITMQRVCLHPSSSIHHLSWRYKHFLSNHRKVINKTPNIFTKTSDRLIR